jgi:hypothetical protein
VAGSTVSARVRIDMITNDTSLADANVLVIGTAAAFTILGILSFTMLLFVYRRATSRPVRLSVIAVIILVFLAVPIAIGFTISALNRTNGASLMMIHPGWPLTLAPGVISLLAAVLLNRRRHQVEGR